MSETKREEPKESEPGPGAMFQAGAEPPSGGGRTGLIVVGVLVAVGGVLAVRALVPSTPAPVPIVSAKPAAPKPLVVPEGTMVKVPGGSFQMGSTDGDPDEKPIVDVKVEPFEIDATEVTIAAYTKCVNAGKCTAPDTGMYCNWQKPGRDDHPVNCVDWKQATDYCSFAGKRLPTEQEWEFAARGTDGRKYPWGPATPATQLCWNGEGNDTGSKGGRQGTCPVASYPSGASPFGAYDMAGNVWEWTSEPYCPYGQRGCGEEKRVIRGGAWNNLVPQYVRAQDRATEMPKSRPENVGFRCAK
jgi:formylglycine-generating enzyme required for sulfatase activity